MRVVLLWFVLKMCLAPNLIEPMYMALEKLGIPRGAAGCVLYVGDHIRDIDAGKSAGMSTILAAYGYIPPRSKNLKKWGADYITDTPEDLNKLLLSSR